jgi:lipocalin
MMSFRSNTVLLILSSLQLIFTTTTLAQQCPKSGFDSVQELDLTKFVGDRWYSIRQLPVSFQPIDQFNCVYAQYSILKPAYTIRCRLFGCTDPTSISVFNSARVGSTTGRPVSVKFRAIIPDITNNPSKANVGPRFIPNFVRGSRTNYWIVAVGAYNELDGLESEPDSSLYQWAIITTGLPTSGSDNKCYTDSGMWFFSREPVPPTGYDTAVTDIATNLGLDASVLQPVNHSGCDYENQSAGFVSNIFTIVKGFF